MEAIILAGGLGMRLRSLVSDRPKPMALIGEKPFLAILLDTLQRQGFRHIVLSVGYLAEKISGYFGYCYQGMAMSYAVEPYPLGTGGATCLALTKCQTDHVFIFNGDTYLAVNINMLERLWQANHHAIMVARYVADSARYDRLHIENGCLRGFHVRSDRGAGLINAGCYVLARHQLDSWPLLQRFSLEEDFFAQVHQTQDIDVFNMGEGLFIDIGVPKDLVRAQSVLRDFG